jgi:hypothetical protein
MQIGCMKPRFDTNGKPGKAIGSSPREKEMRDTLKFVLHGMMGIHGLTAYDNATEKSRQPKEHFTINLSKEIEAINRVLGE